MKVIELFEADSDNPGRGLPKSSFHKPKYDPERKILLGSVHEWLDSMGITKEHIKKAIDIIKNETIFEKDFPEAGLVYDHRAGGEKNGTLTFKLKSGESKNAGYSIYANGQIRYFGDSEFHKERQTRLMSLKPRVRAGDPVGSLVMIYKAAMKELLSKVKKSSKKEEK